MFHSKPIQLTLAVAAFIVATVLAFTSLAISETHDIAAGACMVIAQFLLLCASLLGIDYKLNHYGTTFNERNPKQQPPEYTQGQFMAGGAAPTI